MSSELQGAAAEPPAENEQATTAAEFAARWNRRAESERQAWLDSTRYLAQMGQRCWLEQHEQLQARLASAEARLAAIARLTDDRMLYVDPLGVDSRRLRELLYGPLPVSS